MIPLRTLVAPLSQKENYPILTIGNRKNQFLTFKNQLLGLYNSHHETNGPAPQVVFKVNALTAEEERRVVKKFHEENPKAGFFLVGPLTELKHNSSASDY